MREGLSLASITTDKMRVKYRQPDLIIPGEQTKTAPEGAAIRATYLTRWLRWTQAGLTGEPLLLAPYFTGNADTG